MHRLRDLYMATNIDGLDLSLPKLQNRKIKLLVETSHRMYSEAESNLNRGDEEMAYVHFMKYFQLVKHIRKMPEFSREKEYYEKLIGPIKVKTAIDKAELLWKSLNQRYLMKFGEPQVRLPLENVVERPQPQTPATHKTTVTVPKETVSVAELYNMLQAPQIGVLVMDCRSHIDFEASHLIYGNCLNVPAEVIHTGMSAGKIQSELSPAGKALWGSRSIKDHIVLMDWQSKGHRLSQPIQTLKNILLNWDQDVTYSKPIVILDEGYESFKLVYPMMTTNPEYVPSMVTSNHSADNLEAIEYPDISEIQMKDDHRFKDGNDAIGRPRIDRTSKFAAEKAYNVNHEENMRERERLHEKSLQEQKEALDAELTLKAIAMKDEINLDTKKAEQSELDEQALRNQLIEMEDNIIGYKEEIDRLQSLMANDKRATELSRQEEANLNIRIAETKKEEQRILLERKRLQQERLTFEQEKQRKQEQSIPKRILAKQPSFDRSVKPSSIVSDEIVREFHPEPGAKGPGLCGLKNLGNTCYMNSIMQCLSNTVLLKEYFISDDGYKRDRNRNGKVQRHIADEVSAVMREIWLNKHRHISSYDLRRIVGQFQQIFRGMDQQDSHEFLTILMDWLHSDLQRADMTAPLKTKLSASDKAWQEFVKCKESYILNLFYGQIKSTVKCTVCGRESATYEGFSNLSLELPATSSKCDINECMEMYFFGERISGWKCPHCNELRDAIKKLDISKLPPILVIHFKRFNVDLESSTNAYKKKQNFVKFPLTGLDVNSYIAPSERNRHRVSNTIYNLYGVSNHYGTMERGHYTAFCKSSLYGKWYKYDDHIVSPMDSSDVISSAGYILFYTTFE